MLTLFESMMVVAGFIVLAACGYLALLAVMARRHKHSPDPCRFSLDHERLYCETSFDIIVPAHEEADNIGATIDSLIRIDYPKEKRRIIVIADNCSDNTASVAEGHGAIVWERRNPRKRGKGFALTWAFEKSLSDNIADAVVVIDADTLVSPNLLRAFAARIAGGARAMQAEYGVRNPDDSWRTVLMTLALALFHKVRSLGRERLGLSAGLRGNGMCFTSDLLIQCPHQAFSVVEDLEHGLNLGEQEVRVHYVAEAEVLGEMPAGDQASRVQRARWEAGRIVLARERFVGLFVEAVRRRSALMLDLAVDLILPPLSTLGGWAACGLIGSVTLSLIAGSPGIYLWLFTAACILLLLHLIRGLMLSGMGWKGVQVFMWAPVYLFWRLFKVTGHRRRASSEWERTPRKKRVAG